MQMDEDDDDVPKLSAHALAALQEFYAAQSTAQQTHDEKEMPSEDWNLSQFWYDNHTATVLAEEAVSIAGKSGRIACVSCPSVYKKIVEIKPESCRAVILEYDHRFNVYKEDFIFYDYNKPSELPNDFSKAFDVVVVDPPFLSDECLTKTAVSVRIMAKEKIILCTGAIMEVMAEKLLGLKKCSFLPRHERNLANEFRCYINYDSPSLQANS